MNEADLRVQRTRKRLRQAIIELLEDSDYEALSIRDITRQAQVGYKTFFRHYKSKEDLLMALLEELMQDFQSRIQTAREPRALAQNTRVVLQFADEHKPLALALLRSPLAKQLLVPVFKMGWRDGQRAFAGSELPVELAAHHFSTSMLSLVHWWLEHQDLCAMDEMEAYINTLLIQPLQVR